MAIVFKICPRPAWQDAKHEGTYTGSPDDQRDGFIHLSTAPQLAGTLRKHFGGQSNLVLIAFDPKDLGPALKWEPSRDGMLFPHLYGPLAPDLALWAHDLARDQSGQHVLPEEAQE